MTDGPTGAPTPEAIPEAVLAEKRGISMVWLIPIVALIIGGWLAYKTYSEQGPEIEIQFKSAAGLQAGKTKVKYKDVEVGEVISIVVSEDMQHIVVRARLVAGAETDAQPSPAPDRHAGRVHWWSGRASLPSPWSWPSPWRGPGIRSR